VPYRRWPAAEKAALLAAFRTSGQSVVAFCRTAGVPLATFTLWQRTARRSLTQPRFARVALAEDPADAAPAVASARLGVRAIVRNEAGATLALEGLDAALVRDLVALLLAGDHAVAP
jgi:transposase-like protein